MSWDNDSLWFKSKVYFQRAFNEERTSEVFGLWCAMGLELLSRSTVSHFSPCLLAEPDKEQKNLLTALGFNTNVSQAKSISTSQVLKLCKDLITDFNEEEMKLSLALAGRRNEEVHSGSAAFIEYKPQQWIGPFYKCCKILSQAQNRNLIDLFGEDEATVAQEIISELDKQVIQYVKTQINAYEKVFNDKLEEEKETLRILAEQQGETLSHNKHHKVKCPACSCTATVQGSEYGKEQIENKENEIITRRSVIPTSFLCPACGLKLNGYAQLAAAGVADHYTNRTHYTPQEFYELIDPNDHDSIASYAEDHGYYHFSND
ncbi:hypothetical protein N0H69_12690 [Yersinia alsatica]|uniref:Uncharacterized protein n=1 Tax=Yersinia alsatica TaxID=2890317 RepID=A0ABY5UJE6_9GAMM|nr:hypothetical protein [Yersinia alsatica]UWM43587.1 hypothetical protein N0H69_12690 [Yersinia alsatica]CNK68893.1 Uncharacterised protein [Yersinia frederiksenii]CNL53228.1 Uncharacterised protein [Yersinia frederiksenii]